MPATSPPTCAGWYRDPEDPVRLRHWNGRAWDPRHRTMPAWAIGAGDYISAAPNRRDGEPTLEGPVQRAALPAIATATAQSSRPGGGPGASGLLGARRTTGAGPGALHWSSGAGPVRRAPWPNPRSAFAVGAALVGLVVVILVVSVGFVSRPATDLTLAQDSAFISSASIDCGEAMGAIRLTPATPGSSVAPGPAAVAAANADLTRLEAKIRALPVVASAQGQVTGLLDAWSRYATDRQRQADAGPGAATAGSLTSTVGFDVAQANATVTGLGLTNCTLGPTASMTAS